MKNYFFIFMATFLCTSLYSFDWEKIKISSYEEKKLLQMDAQYETHHIIIKDSIEPTCKDIPIHIENPKEFQEIYGYKNKKFLKAVPFNGNIQITITDFHDLKNIPDMIELSYDIFDPKTNTISREYTSIANPFRKTEEDNICKEEATKKSSEDQEKKDFFEKKEKEKEAKESCCKLKTISIESILSYAKNIHFIFVSCIVLILGLIMSFTPCIYPMIPITIAILGIDRQPLTKRIFSASLYVLGIALAFSIFGLLASSGKMVFGSFFQHTWFVSLLLIFLTIMTLNMLDITNISLFSFQVKDKIPSCIQNSSLLPFFYGIFSGTISSPCVSPGLFALLTIVAEQGNLFIGWLWLFCFGIGLGLPLWIVAVLFGSDNFLLKSGLWLIEIKEIFALLLLIVLYKHAYVLFGAYGILYVLTLFALFCFKKYKENFKSSYWLCSWSVLLGFIITGSLCYATYKKEKQALIPSSATTLSINWIKDLDKAKEIAKKESKPLLIDFTADWCSACKTIEKNLFQNHEFVKAYNDKIIFCKIDCTQHNQEHESLLDAFDIKGLPTIILIKPNGKQKKHGSEITKKIIEDFISDQ